MHKTSEVTDLIPPLDSTENGVRNGASSPIASSSKFLQQVDQDLIRLKEKARVYDISITTSTTASDVARMRQTARANRSDCQGDDCGLSWTHILGIALLVLLACPLLYFLYLELNLHRTANETSSEIHQSHVDAVMNMSSSSNIS